MDSPLRKFDRHVVLTLRRRPERLDAFRAAMAPYIGVAETDVVYGTDGHALPMPYDWTMGAGAWGCMQSHRRILERAIEDGVQSILIMEDDCRPASGVGPESVATFLRSIPSGWHCLMMGGQHFATPTPVAPGVVKCLNTQRTHCYAVRQPFLNALYQKWVSSSGHCDHILGPFAGKPETATYAPDQFLFAQAGGHSDITCQREPQRAWRIPTQACPLVYFQGPTQVLHWLRSKGGWNGKRMDSATSVDMELSPAQFYRHRPMDHYHFLSHYINNLQVYAVARDMVPVFYHPDITAAQAEQACQKWPFRVLKAESKEAAAGPWADLVSEARRAREGSGPAPEKS